MKVKEYITALKALGRTLISTDHPLSAHLVATHRCNLSYTYCNEYDKFSAPVPLDEIKKRIERLANLKTATITCTGGEPLLHPEMETIIKEICHHNIIPTMITNGYLLTEKLIKKLNKAGLQQLQISIDNIEPDEVSYKSLKLVDRKLKLLAKHAVFKFNINSVLGISDERTPDAIAVAKRAIHYGFSNTVGILHNGDGILKPMSEIQRQAYNKIGQISRSFAHRLYYRLFQRNLIEGKPNSWKCRAGARYLYICEDGLVHRCSQQRGYPGIPLQSYTVENIRQEFNTQKDCAPRCTVSCVHVSSLLDEWRSKQPRPDPQAGNDQQT